MSETAKVHTGILPGPGSLAPEVITYLQRIESKLNRVLRIEEHHAGRLLSTTDAAPLLNIGRTRLARLCREAWERGTATILDDDDNPITFKKTGGGDVRPRFSVFVPSTFERAGQATRES